MADAIAELRKRLDAIVQNNKKEEDQAPIVPVVPQAQNTAEAENAEDNKPKDENSIWVGNLDASVTQEKLENHFSCCGKIKKLTIPTKQNPHAPKYAYIEFDSKEAAQLAIDSLNNHLFSGRNLNIKPKRENRPGMRRSFRRSRH